jgi:hypothetical protein
VADFKIIYLSVFFSIKAIFKRKINIKLTVVTIQNILFIFIPQNHKTECPLYNTFRHDFIEKVESHCSNFSSLNNSSKFIWLLANENLTVLKELGLIVSSLFNSQRMSTDYQLT